MGELIVIKHSFGVPRNVSHVESETEASDVNEKVIWLKTNFYHM